MTNKIKDIFEVIFLMIIVWLSIFILNKIISIQSNQNINTDKIDYIYQSFYDFDTECIY